MKVLSLFDGMSCGMLAFDRAGIKVEKYYASEIDKYAEAVSKKNYPEIIRFGDITKWREWDIEQPDLIIGGSPCQGFSLAGKKLNFDDTRSALFFTYRDIVNHYSPKYFLLENVKMKKEIQDAISEQMGVEPMLINSALVSAQNRVRLYWFNWNCEQPEDRGIILKDVIQTPGDCIKISRKGKYKLNQDKMSCLTGGHRGDANHSDMDLIGQKYTILEMQLI